MSIILPFLVACENVFTNLTLFRTSEFRLEKQVKFPKEISKKVPSTSYVRTSYVYQFIGGTIVKIGSKVVYRSITVVKLGVWKYAECTSIKRFSF